MSRKHHNNIRLPRNFFEFTWQNYIIKKYLCHLCNFALNITNYNLICFLLLIIITGHCAYRIDGYRLGLIDVSHPNPNSKKNNKSSFSNDGNSNSALVRSRETRFNHANHTEREIQSSAWNVGQNVHMPLQSCACDETNPSSSSCC